MIEIRAGIFETNSSSTHAICISYESPKLPVSENTYELYFGHGDYGWENRILSDVLERASYLNEAINSFDDMKKVVYREKLIEILRKYNIRCNFANNYFEVTSYGEECYDSGYIDHGWETEEFVEAVLEDEDLLLRYLFSPNSMVVTGNDNCECCYPDEVLKDTKDEYTIFWKWN